MTKQRSTSTKKKKWPALAAIALVGKPGSNVGQVAAAVAVEDSEATVSAHQLRRKGPGLPVIAVRQVFPQSRLVEMVGMFDPNGKPQGERIAEVGFEREPYYVYFFRGGDVWRCSVIVEDDGTTSPGVEEVFRKLGLEEDRKNYLYWIDALGDIWRVRTKRSRGAPSSSEHSRSELLYSLFPYLSVPKSTINVRLVQDEAGRIFEAINQRTDLDRLSDRQLEVLLAEVFRREGFETYLTPKSRDGGRDVIAAKPGAVPLLVLGEAKKMQVVRPSLIHSLAGVVSRDRANVAVLATTGSFSTAARSETLAAWGSRIDLKDGDQLTAWINGLKRRP